MSTVSFNLHSLPNRSASATVENMVERHLSAGEMRQSILDRIKEDVETDEGIELLNKNLEDFGFPINPELFQTDEAKKQLIDDVEDVLYEAQDEEFFDTYWNFTDELILIEPNN